MKNKFILIIIIIMSLFIFGCKDKVNDNNDDNTNNGTEDPGDNTPPTESKVAIHFMYRNATQVDIQTKQDESTVTYTLTSEDKVEYFTTTFEKIGFYGTEKKDDLEAKYIVTITDDYSKTKEIKIYNSYIYLDGHYYTCKSGLEFIDEYNSNNVDKTSSDSGWLPFI